MSYTLLSIDWDWITGDCADGQHGCCGWCEPPCRKLTRGVSVCLRKDWLVKLEQLRKVVVKNRANLWVAECHADILRVLDPIDEPEIIDLDSHADDSFWFGLSCGSWKTFLPRDVTVKKVDGNELGNLTVNNVFICQSSPWTPASLDKYFLELVCHFSDIIGRDPIFIGHKRTAIERAYDQWKRKNEIEVII